MHPPPLHSTLSPYTTLFRSKPLVCGSDSTLAVAPFEPAHDEVRTRYLLEVVDEGVVHRCTAERADDRHSLCCELDRKSTRLNSSHLGISYAVFCLTKKKINI